MDLIDSGKIHVAIISYGRPKSVKTLDVFPFATIWVCESQEADYRSSYGSSVRSIPDELDGSCARKRNAVLDLCPSPWILMLDDDVTRVSLYEGGEKYDLSPSDLRLWICHCFQLAEELGVHLWGVRTHDDPLYYQTYTPFSLLKPIYGPLYGHLSHSLRFDEEIRTMDDIAMWLLQIYTYRRTLRFNKVVLAHHQAIIEKGDANVEGGIDKTLALARADHLRMVSQFGPAIFRDPKRAGRYGAINSTVIPGQ